MFTTLLQQAPIIEINNNAASAPATQAAAQEWPIGSIIIAALVAAVVFGWFGLRYWLAVTRPAAIKEVETPRINRMSAAALDHMVGESAEDAEAELEAMRHEAAPDDLLAVIPPEEVQVNVPTTKSEDEKQA
jgi:hypothetical protein